MPASSKVACGSAPAAEQARTPAEVQARPARRFGSLVPLSAGHAYASLADARSSFGDNGGGGDGAPQRLIRASVPERVAMLLTGHKSRAIFDRYNIIHEQELLDAGDQLVAYLVQQAQAPRGRSHPASPRTASPLRLVRRSTA